MNTIILPPRLGSPRPWHSRAWRFLINAAAAAAQSWRERQRMEREHRERALLAELDPRVLSDIGAPDWLEAEAYALRDAHRAERDQLRLSGAAIDTRYG